MKSSPTKRAGQKERNLDDLTREVPEGLIQQYLDTLPVPGDHDDKGTVQKTESTPAQEDLDDMPRMKRRRGRKPARPMSSVERTTHMSVSPEIPDTTPPRRGLRSAGANTPAVEEQAREPPTTRAKVKDKSAKAPHISLSLGTELDEEYKPQVQTRKTQKQPKSGADSVAKIPTSKSSEQKGTLTRDHKKRRASFGLNESLVSGLSSSKKERKEKVLPAEQGPSSSKKAQSTHITAPDVITQPEAVLRNADSNSEPLEEALHDKATSTRVASPAPRGGIVLRATGGKKKNNKDKDAPISVYAGSARKRLEGKYHLAENVIETTVESEACVVGPSAFMRLANLRGPWEKHIFVPAEEGYDPTTLGAWLKAACQVCKKPTNAETMLVCDGCEQGYHMHCLSPPLKEIPNDDWFCTQCASNQ